MSIKDYFLNIPGSKKTSKVIIIQSDDWGSIRMPSKKIFQKLNSHRAIDVNNDYCKYDTLASADDLECLFEVLTSVKDRNNNHPVINANCILTNPNFKKIKEDNYNTYHFDSLQKTFENYNNENALKLWKEGLEKNIFSPQYHGREHVNVPFWLYCLKQDIPGVRYAFECNTFGASFKELPFNQTNFQRAWDLLNPNAPSFINKSIIEGLKLFEEEFGFPSKTVIAPNYTWSVEQEKVLFEKGVKYMQGMLRQRIPIGNGKPYKYKYRFTSNPTKNKIGFLRRNIFFEPSQKKANYKLDQALLRIDMAFKAKKPAIIGTHRINYVGVHNIKNRDDNLILLKALLKNIIKKWPDAVFITSQDIDNEKNKR